MPSGNNNVLLNLDGIQDQNVRDNFRVLQDFLNSFGMSQKQFQACEIYVTANTTGLKIKHNLGGVPLDFIITRLIAPSAARLKANFSSFTKTDVSVDITGLAAGEVLSARFLVGSFTDVVTPSEVIRADTEVQELRGKF